MSNLIIVTIGIITIFAICAIMAVSGHGEEMKVLIQETRRVVESIPGFGSIISIKIHIPIMKLNKKPPDKHYNGVTVRRRRRTRKHEKTRGCGRQAGNFIKKLLERCKK